MADYSLLEALLGQRPRRSLMDPPDPDARTAGEERMRGVVRSLLGWGAGTADAVAETFNPGLGIVRQQYPGAYPSLTDRLDNLMGKTPGLLGAAMGEPIATPYDEGALLTDIASLLMPAGWLRKVGNLPSSRASRNVKMGAPEPRPQRPFEHDYPSTSGTPGSPLQFDIEGRPLTAPTVVGRTHWDAPDNLLEQAQSDRVASALGATTRVATGRELGKDIGRYKSGSDSQGNRTREILIRKGLDPETTGRVQRHELGHLIEDLVYGKQIEAKGLQSELTQVYDELNRQGRFNAGRPWSPAQEGYKGDDIAREYMAEALRAYMADPNYLKSVAPKTAAAIREAVNANQNLNRVIQFNQMGGAGVGLGATGGGLLGMPPDDIR